MLRQFLLYSTVNQLCIYKHPLSFRFSSHIGHVCALESVSCSLLLDPGPSCLSVSVPVSLSPSPLATGLAKNSLVRPVI